MHLLSLLCFQIPQCDDEIKTLQQNCEDGDKKNSLIQEKDIHNDVEDSPPPYERSPFLNLPEFSHSLDDAIHSSLLVKVSHPEKGVFCQSFASVISQRRFLPKEPFPRGCILYEPETGAEDVFQPGDKYSIQIYLKYSKDNRDRICCDTCNPHTQTIKETNLYTYIEPQSKVRIFFKLVSKDDPSQGSTFHAVSIDRNFVRQLIGV